jgi:hypothetical protein
MLIYKINQSTLYYDGTIEVPDDPKKMYGIPFGTTRTEPPEIPNDHYAVWSGSGWIITDIPSITQVEEQNEESDDSNTDV